MLSAVILGAFGAHGLKELVEPSALITFKTGVFYQFIHALSILILVILMKIYSIEKLNQSIIAFIIGIVFFSGSLYLLAIKTLLNLDLSFIGPFTPIGGLFFIIGWFLVLVNISRNKKF